MNKIKSLLDKYLNYNAEYFDPSEVEKIIEDAYKQGYKDALYNYAWHKDGVMYVGCGVRTYKEALEKDLK